MSVNPTEWTLDDVASWLDSTVNLPQLKDQWKQKGITGQKLLSFTIRDLDGLGVPFMKTRAVDFQIQKLKEVVTTLKREAEDKEREAIINQKISQVQNSPTTTISTTATTSSETSAQLPFPQQTLVQVQQEKPEPKSISTQQTSIDPSVIITWTPEILGSWISSQVFLENSSESANLQQYFITKKISGSNLENLELRSVIRDLNLSDIGIRRRAEHAISKLRDSIKEQILKKQEEEKRIDKGIISSQDKSLSLVRSLGDGITLFKEIILSPRDGKSSRVVFSVETSSDKPSLLVINVVMEGVSWNFGLSNSVSIWIPPIKGKREICNFFPIEGYGEWSIKYSCTQRIGVLEDFISVQDERTCREISLLLEMTKKTKDEISSMEASVLRQILADLNLHFTDPHFPPTKKSLYIDIEDLPKKAVPLEWQRPAGIIGGTNWKLFGDPVQVSPNHIEQGRLGNCWFMGALSIIAARPQLVLNMFITKEISKIGLYEVRFFRSGRWQHVIVDDYLPNLPLSGVPAYDLDAMQQMMTALPGHLVYARARENLMWVCILEKAYAKLNLSYQALTAGTLSESLTDLTGAPCVFYNIDFYTNKEFLWEKLLEAHKKGNLMGVSTIQPTPEEEALGKKIPEKVGLVSRHAYSLLDVKEINGLRLLRLRNPWGRFCWTGDYSDDDQKWTSELKKAVNFVREEGTFWIPWNAFLEWFSEFTICKIGAEEPFVQTLQGVYDNTNRYGPHFEISVSAPTKLFITLQKQDLRFSVGADKDNRHGIYLLRKSGNSTEFQYIDATGDWTRREVTLEVTLEPWTSPYLLICSARIGNIKFREVPWILKVQSEKEIQISRSEFNLTNLSVALIKYMQHNSDNVEVLKHSMFGLMYYAFYDTHRKVLSDNGALDIAKFCLEKFGTDKDLVKETLSLVWNLGCDSEVRKTLNSSGWPDLIKQVREKFYKNEEVQEIADVTLRSLKLSQGMAMEPLIEKCIIADACTFSVTGKTTFLLQVWFDCFSCNLRSNFGICQTCSLKCHAGHQLSAPKFGRFFCDCGHGEAYRSKKIGVPCVCVKSSEHLGLQKKRAQDENYRADDDDDPHPNPNPVPFPFPFPMPPSQNPRHPTKKEDKPKIATLFNT